jgi:hypothetical protein
MVVPFSQELSKTTIGAGLRKQVAAEVKVEQRPRKHFEVKPNLR